MSYQPGAVAQISPSAVGTIISYTEITTGVTIAATVEASADVVITAPGFVPNGTDAFWIDFYCPSLASGAGAGAFTVLCLFDNGTTIGQGAITALPSDQHEVHIRQRIVPTAVVHAYSIRGFRAVANGAVNAGAGGAGAYRPAFLSITKA